MANSLEVLNGVKDLIVKFANENNINLQEEFSSLKEFRGFVIAFTFKSLRDMGMDTQEAFDIVAGDGAYEDLISKTYSDILESN